MKNKIQEKLLRIKSHLNVVGEKISQDDLIKFDYRAVLLLGGMILLFVFLVLFKVHGSSIPLWNKFMHDKGQSDAGLIYGTPRAIRGDEWKVQTPFILSQLNHVPAMPEENDALGAGKTPLLMNLPVRHYSAIFRPQNWGFFVLDQERGLSFYWNFRALVFIASFFLVLMLITRSAFWISFLGALWLYFSSFIQWWFSTSLIDAVLSISVIFVGSAYLFFSRKKSGIILGAILAMIFGINFALLFYPPFQVPLAYLLLFLIIGFGVKNFSAKDFKKHSLFRFSAIAVAAGISAFVLYHFYLDVKDTIALVRNTAYPGKRISLGGGVDFKRYFSGFYDLFFSEDKVPAVWGNISEASNFILLYPLVLASAGAAFIRRKKVDSMVWLLGGYILALTLWMVHTISESFAQATLMSFVTPERAFAGLGVANILLVAYFLSDLKPKAFAKNVVRNWLMLGAVLIFSIIYGLTLRSQTDNFFGPLPIIIVSLVLVTLGYLLIIGRGVVFSLLIVIPLILANGMVNPVSIGLDPIYKKQITPFIQNIQKKDPTAKWVFFNSSIDANFLKAVGVDAFNGIKYVPNLNDFRILDPEGKFLDNYNRYALIVFSESKVPGLVTFNSFSQDTYFIEADPCAEKLKQLGVRYFVFTKEPVADVSGCMKPMSSDSISRVWVYERK